MLKFLHIGLLVCIFALSFPLQVHAVQMGVCDGAQAIEWLETGTQSFSILYPRKYEVIGRRLSARQGGNAIDSEYARFAALYGQSLPLPVSIRIYPDTETYSCLNARAGEISPEAIHAHTGTREIALIGENILEDFAAWSQNDINLIRFELGSLFARQIAGDNIPLGLLMAVSRFGQDPDLTIGYLQLNWQDWVEPTYDWRNLWEEVEPQPSLGRQLQATSTVAYLVDTFGWEQFITYLQSLPGSRSYSQLLSQIYGNDIDTLEDDWRAYYPSYFQGGWKSHIVYNYNLDGFRDLIRQEKYREADRGLQSTILFIQKMKDPIKLREALQLQHLAKLGQEGEYLWGQSQQAFQAGNYPGALDLIDQAELKFAQTGNRMYHLDELSAYRDQVRKVLVMHAELEEMQISLPKQLNTFSAASSLVDMGRRFNQLGDMQGHARVIELARVIEKRQQAQFLLLTAVVCLLVLTLLLIRIFFLRKLPPPEAQL